MKLYSYWRSTTSIRVRAALNLKGLDYDIQPVDLVAGVQRGADYTAVNPGRGVPALVRRLARADELLPRPLADNVVDVAVALDVLRWRGR